MTERRSDDDDEDGRDAGRRSQTRAVSDPAAPARPAPGPKPAGVWGQTIALGAAVPPPEQPPAPKPAPKHAPRTAVPERAVVVVAPVHAGQPKAPSAPAPQPGRAHQAQPSPVPPTSQRPDAEAAAHAAEPLRVPSARPPPTPYKTAQRSAPKGTLLMTGLGADGRPSTPQTPTPAAARPPAAQTVPLGGDGRLRGATPVAAQVAAPAAPAHAPAAQRNQAAPPGATRPMRPAGRERDELDLGDVSSGQHAAPSPDLSFAQTMPSVPPEAMPPQAALAAEPPRQPPATPVPAAPARASRSQGRQEIRLQLAAADFVQGAPSSIPAGIPRRNPMVMITGVLVLALIGVLAWVFLGRKPAPAPVPVPEAAAPTAETPTPAALPTVPIAPEAQPSAVTPTPAAKATSTPEAKAEPAPSDEPAAKATPKTTARRKTKSKSKAGAPSDDVSAARDALRSLQGDPVLKVKPSRDEDEDVLKLVPADAPPAPPAPGE